MIKKNIFRTIIALLVVIFAMSGFVACKNNNNTSGGGSSDGGNDTPAADVTAHKVEGTLHDVNVDYNKPIGNLLTPSGAADYTVVAPEKFAVAAKFITKHLSAATKADFKLEIGNSCDLDDDKYIVLGLNDVITEKVTVPEYSVLGNCGYYIKTVGDDVLAYCTTTDAAQLTAIAILREIIGYDMMSYDCVVYEREETTVPTMEIAERPDYEYRIPSNSMKAEGKYGMGFTLNNGMLLTDFGNVHNMYDFFTTDDLINHSKWFSEDAMLKDEAGNKVRIGQPCFTAHGDEAEYEALVNHLAAQVIAKLKSTPSLINMRISPNDVLGENMTFRCTCNACNASYAYYGTMGGAMLSYANDVAAKVYEYIDAEEPGRAFNVVVLAYGESVQAPVQRKDGKYVLDKDGKGIPVVRYDFDEDGNSTAVMDENGKPVNLVCERGVAYEFAASKANWIHSFYESENSEFSAAVEAWAGLGASNLFIWSYEISYYQYLYPYNNYQIMLENFRYFKQYGGNYIYPEGTWENANNPGFAKLRDYINSKGMFDVNSDYNEIIDKFFKYYFREAAPVMRNYFNEVQINLALNEGITGGKVHSYALSDDRVWPEALVTNWLNSFDDAYKAIEKYADLDPELYTALSTHILIESLFPRYVLCTKYSSSFSDGQLKAMRKSFLTDFQNLGNTTHEEHYTISEITSSWVLD